MFKKVETQFKPGWGGGGFYKKILYTTHPYMMRMQNNIFFVKIVKDFQISSQGRYL